MRALPAPAFHVQARVDHERTTFCEQALVALQRVGVEDRGRGMDVDATAGVDPVLAQVDPSLGSDRQCHAVSPSQWRKSETRLSRVDRISYARCAPGRR